ncbi:MAG: ABC transporter permease [Planctomycetota bacterium]
MTFLFEIIRLGITNLRLHLLRSVLTALGIILGIAAVIVMMAIAEGSKQKSLQEYEILGANVIIVRSQRPAEQNSMAGGQSSGSSWVNNYGLTRQDLRRIEDQMQHLAEIVVPLKEVGSNVTRRNKRLPAQVFGTTPDLMDCANISLSHGRYLTDADVESEASVCVIGHAVARNLFPLEDPIDQAIRIDEKAFTVVGVLNPVGLAGGTGSALVGRDLNLDVHIPMSTAEASFGDIIFRRTAGQRDNTRVEIEEIYVKVPNTDIIMSTASVTERIIGLNHPDMEDVSIIVPYELLEAARRVAETWTRVMLAIAAIALLVGGIGIMNIMLASVTERTREIGIRRALGATRIHVIWQFLVETGVLSILGGIIGILIGVGLALALNRFIPDQFPTQITGWSIIVSFIVATSVGLIFGLYPANVAASQDPIVALRHD